MTQKEAFQKHPKLDPLGLQGGVIWVAMKLGYRSDKMVDACTMGALARNSHLLSSFDLKNSFNLHKLKF